MKSLAQYIDHTHLKPTCTNADIQQLCKEAIKYGFAAVCVPPTYVNLAKKLTNNTSVKVCTVVGFPNGYQTTTTKLTETKEALNNGASEIDMVINIGWLHSEHWVELEEEIKALNQLCKAEQACLKVIIETALLTTKQIIAICKCCAAIGVAYVKTSTGFSHKGATVANVTLMRQHLPSTIKIKAAGGIKTAKFARELLQAGANRLGCSSSVAIVKEAL